MLEGLALQLRALGASVGVLRALRAISRRSCTARSACSAASSTVAAFLESNIAAGLDSGFLESTCVSCGACADYTPEAVQEITGNPAAELERAAHIYGEAASGSLLWGLGVTEHKYGSEVVQLLCNLAMMTGKVGKVGKVGKAGSALLPLRGQNNVQGSSDMGALPDPDTAHVVAALENLEFVVCQEIFENETTKYADVVLPASAFLEKSGTFINAERPFQAVEPAIDPPGGARTDFDIITTVSRMLGHEMGWQTPWDALDEIARLTPTYADVPARARAGHTPRMAECVTAATRRRCTTRRSTT